MGGLIAAALLAIAIVGAQLLPILEYSRQSFRANETEGFHNVYPFSVLPFQLPDTIWPNLFGTIDRGNRAWMGALLPYDDRLLGALALHGRARPDPRPLLPAPSRRAALAGGFGAGWRS